VVGQGISSNIHLQLLSVTLVHGSGLVSNASLERRAASTSARSQLFLLVFCLCAFLYCNTMQLVFMFTIE